MSRVVTTATVEGDRVRLDSCPGCHRPVVLDHATSTAGGIDPELVARAQRLHLRSCTG